MQALNFAISVTLVKLFVYLDLCDYSVFESQHPPPPPPQIYLSCFVCLDLQRCPHSYFYFCDHVIFFLLLNLKKIDIIEFFHKKLGSKGSNLALSDACKLELKDSITGKTAEIPERPKNNGCISALQKLLLINKYNILTIMLFIN